MAFADFGYSQNNGRCSDTDSEIKGTFLSQYTSKQGTSCFDYELFVFGIFSSHYKLWCANSNGPFD